MLYSITCEDYENQQQPGLGCHSLGVETDRGAFAICCRGDLLGLEEWRAGWTHRITSHETVKHRPEAPPAIVGEALCVQVLFVAGPAFSRPLPHSATRVDDQCFRSRSGDN